MNYLLVPDKFKGSLSAAEVIKALKKGILQIDQNANIHSALVSDGGDGFVESIANYTESIYVECVARSVLMREQKGQLTQDYRPEQPQM